MLKAVGKKIPQYVFKNTMFLIGGLFIIKDIFDIGSEATRLTTPMIINVSIMRTIQKSES